MPFFIVTMKQVIRHEYRVEAFDAAEAMVMAHEMDKEDNWYRNGYDGDVITTVSDEMTPEDIQLSNELGRSLSEYIHKMKDKK